MKFWASVAFAPIDQYAALATAAEEAGYFGMLLADHLVSVRNPVSRYPYSVDGMVPCGPEAPFPDPWVAIASLAATTQTLRFGSSVYVAPARDLLTVAKAVGTAAVLSGDRVTFGVGAGWMEDEFVLTGQQFSRRGERLDEMLDVLRKLWSGGWVDHAGTFYTLPGVQMKPAPAATVPIWAGGYSEPALRRATKRCDGWVGVAADPEQATNIISRIHQLLATQGRDPQEFDVVFSVPGPLDVAAVTRWEELGVTGLIARPWANRLTAAPDSLLIAQRDVSLGEKLEATSRFGEEVVRHFSS